MKIYIPDVFRFSRCFTKPASIDKLTQLTMAFKTFVATVVGALAVTCAASPNAPKPTSAPSHSSYINYTTVTGFFAQDDPATVASTFDYVCAHRFLATHQQSLTENFRLSPILVSSIELTPPIKNAQKDQHNGKNSRNTLIL
jgi:hypothetical protein